MSLLGRLLGSPTPSARNASDERWWGGGISEQAASGVQVNAETALCTSATWACVRLLSETIAALPLPIYRRLDDGGRERAPTHPLYDVLQREPNSWQTAMEFREQMMDALLLRGNAFARIVPGARGAVDQLRPIHPDLFSKVERLATGRLRYEFRDEQNQIYRLNQEDVFHLRGPSADGLVGMSVIEYARESLGLALGAEEYGGKFFGNGSRPSGVLQVESRLSPEAAARLSASWQAAHGGIGNSHKVAVLENGAQWKPIGISPSDAQFLETREFQAEDIARWFRVPPHMIGLTSKATSWGSGIEQMSIGFVTYTLLPWLTRWQQAISRDLIIAPNLYFVEFVVDGLLRGDSETRHKAYVMGRNGGWLSANDVRRMENMNPIPNGDRYLEPLNMGEAGEVPND